ncbi:actin-related protein 5-like [Styela clava]
MTGNQSSFIYEFVDRNSTPDIVCEYPRDLTEDCPLIIDNGSYQYRAGWAINDEPSIIFKNVIAKNRGNRKDRDWDILVGNDIPDLEAVRWMIRTAFDFNIVVNFGIQESVFDHSFRNLGINTEGGIHHPVVLTEPVANPAYCRKQMSELLFEAYNIPKLMYGIDSLFSYQYNKESLNLGDCALVISSGFQSTHILPIIDGNLDLNNVKRINLGGYNNGAYLQRLLQLKYPKQSSIFTLTRMDQFLRDKGEVPLDYIAEMKKWSDRKFTSKNTIMVQVPEKSNPMSGQITNPPCERTISLGKKLRRLEYRYYDLECILELEDENPDAMSKAMSDAGYAEVEDINKKMHKLQTKIDKLHEEMTFLSQNPLPPTEIPIRVERHQALEILFQPSLVGYDQAGIGEVMETIFNSYPEDTQNQMAKNVLITGGNTQYHGFRHRIEAELTKCRPFGSECGVKVSENPTLDAWRGAKKWAMSHMDQEDMWMTRQDYDEHGFEYLKEHKASNKYLNVNSPVQE